jgi:glutamate carboxypeptidase
MTLPAFDTDAILAGIRDWVMIETPTTSPKAVNTLVDRLSAAYEGTGASLERIPGRDGLGDHLIARSPWGQGEKGILILSHLDTVHPIGFLQRLPFRREGDKAYGPGIYDMKGGAYIAFEAFRTLARQRKNRPLPVTHLFVSDEEVGSPTSRAIIEAEARKAKYVLVTEPARDGGKVVTARKGVARYVMTLRGRPAHAGSRHQDGRSAVRELAHQILALEALTDYAKGVTVNIGVVSGGTRPNVVAEEAMAEIDVRIPTMAAAKALLPQIVNRKPVDPDVSISVTGDLNRPPFDRTKGVTELLAKAQTIAAELGIELGETATGGGSDGNFTAPFAPTLDGLGVDGDGAHTGHEHLLVSSIVPRTRLFYRLLETLA